MENTDKKIILKIACIIGDIVLFRYSIKNNKKWDQKMLKFAMINGHLNIIKCARKNGLKITEDFSYYSARNGHLHILKYFVEQKFFLKSKFNLSLDTIKIAAEFGHFEYVKYARQNCWPWHSDVMKYAVIKGNLDMVEYIMMNEDAIYVNEMDMIVIYLAMYGHLHILKVFVEDCEELEHSCDKYWWFRNTVKTASEYGHLDLVKYAYKQIKNSGRQDLLDYALIYLTSI